MGFIYNEFQFTLPCGERQLLCFYRITVYCFNSRSRAGSDRFHLISHTWIHVSIHAPVRGATIAQALNATVGNPFQFTLPCGERLSENAEYNRFISVSIHAPVRGATAAGSLSTLKPLLFQFTLPCGERRSCVRKDKSMEEFQFTLPCGERQKSLILCLRSRSFNSRSRAGSDFIYA